MASRASADGGRSPRARRTSPEHIPTLRHLLERCGAGYHLSLDLNQDSIGPDVIDIVATVDDRDARAAVALRP